MGHDRKPHTRRFPRQLDGYRKPGRVNVKGSHVNDSGSDDGGAGCCCCVGVLLVLVAAASQVADWAKSLFEAIMN